MAASRLLHVCIGVPIAAASVAHAYEFRVRFVERVGSTDTVIGGNAITAAPGEEHRIRIQFGVFDDADSAAPAGGYIGWNVGTINVSGGASNSDEFRNSSMGVHNGVGRLSPFNFAPAFQGANGLPSGDPFEALTAIDNTLGQQAFVWYGPPNPLPQPVIRGLNSFVSTYEFSIRPNPGALPYSIDFGGNLISAIDWMIVGGPPPPDPGDPPVAFSYAPITDTPRAFTASLFIDTVPTPGAAPILAVGAFVVTRRHRKHPHR